MARPRLQGIGVTVVRQAFADRLPNATPSFEMGCKHVVGLTIDDDRQDRRWFGKE